MSSTTISEAFVKGLSDADLASLAERLSPHLNERPSSDRWLDARDAAAYLGIAYGTVRQYASERSIPFHQERPQARLWFKASELDAWRESGGRDAALQHLVGSC